MSDFFQDKADKIFREAWGMPSSSEAFNVDDSDETLFEIVQVKIEHLSNATSRDFRDILKKIDVGKHIILDMQDVQSCKGSACTNSLIMLDHSLEQHSLSLVLVNCTAGFRRELIQLRMENIFIICDSLEQAIQRLS